MRSIAIWVLICLWLLIVGSDYPTHVKFVSWCAAKRARSEAKANGVESKSEDRGADAKQNSQKERKGRPNKKEDSKLQNVQSPIEVPKENLHSVVLVLLLCFFLHWSIFTYFCDSVPCYCWQHIDKHFFNCLISWMQITWPCLVANI